MKGKLLLTAATAAMIGVLLWQWVTLPDQVPGHMGFGGTVDRWGSKSEHLVLMSGATVLLTGLFGWGVPWLLRKAPPGVVNVPYPTYWLVPARRAELARRLGDDMAGLGAATLLLVLFGAVEMGYAATHGHGFAYDWVVFVAYLVAVTAWAVRLTRSSRYRPPDGWRAGDDDAGPGGPAGRGRI